MSGLVAVLDTRTNVEICVPRAGSTTTVPLPLLIESIGANAVGEFASRVLVGHTGECMMTLPLNRTGDAAAPGAVLLPASGAGAVASSVVVSDRQLQRIVRCPHEACGCLCLLPPLDMCSSGEPGGWKENEARCQRAECPEKAWCVHCGKTGERAHDGPCDSADRWEAHLMAAEHIR